MKEGTGKRAGRKFTYSGLFLNAAHTRTSNCALKYFNSPGKTLPVYAQGLQGRLQSTAGRHDVCIKLLLDCCGKRTEFVLSRAAPKHPSVRRNKPVSPAIIRLRARRRRDDAKKLRGIFRGADPAISTLASSGPFINKKHNRR